MNTYTITYTDGYTLDTQQVKAPKMADALYTFEDQYFRDNPLVLSIVLDPEAKETLEAE